MNAKNLPLKFAFLAVVIAVCLYAYKAMGLKEGIDLRGGHSLIFEIRTPETEIAAIESGQNDLEGRIAAANELLNEAKAKLADPQVQKDAAQAKQYKDQVAKAQDDITRYNTEISAMKAKISELQNLSVASADLPDKMISILKERVDPLGLYSLEWRPLGKGRIEVRMPAGQKDSIQAKQKYLEVLQEIERHNLSPSQIRTVQERTGKERQDLINQLAGSKNDKGQTVLSAQGKNVQRLAELHDLIGRKQALLPTLKLQLEKAIDEEKSSPSPAPTPTPKTNVAETTTAKAPLTKVEQAREALASAQKELRSLADQSQQLLLDINDGNISATQLEKTLRSYLSPAEAAALKKVNKEELKRRQKAFDEGLEKIKARYKNDTVRLAEIDKAVASYKVWADSRKRLDDPSDLVALIRKSGVLEFRIAPVVSDGGGTNAISSAEKQRYIDQLLREGPDAGRKRNDRYLWFPLHSTEDIQKDYAGLAVARYTDGRDYLLLHNDAGFTMLNPPGKSQWSLADARPNTDESGRPCVDFRLDERGADLFSRLTKANVDNRMAIMLDDEAYSAPSIRSAISERGQITGSFTVQEVQDMVKTFLAGSLPAKLNPEPVAVSSFGSALGDINKKQAIQAAYYSVIAVGIFMLCYYLLSGLIADFAMVLNIVLIVGTMAALGAVWTMPGIAGVILSIGMSVDANVLINERLREEQARGLPIRMALKNAYERAFSAIFDGNITTLLTCLILGWVGTEEIRGFAITLGLGILFNLFTAVLVTRWVFQLLLEAKIIRTHQYMLHVFKNVPQVDWVSKRYYFWIFSAITLVLGIWSLVAVGNKVWGIEFSAGTQATLVFKTDALVKDPATGKMVLPNDRMVWDIFKDTTQKLIDQTAAGKGVTDRNNQVIDFSDLRDNSRVETVIDPDATIKFFQAMDPDCNVNRTDNKITLKEWKGHKQYFDLMDTNHDGVLEQAEADKFFANRTTATAFRLNTTETRLEAIREVARAGFGTELVTRVKLKYDLVNGKSTEAGDLALQQKLGVQLADSGLTPIDATFKEVANPSFRNDFADFEGGVLLTVNNVSPAITRQEFEQRLADMKVQPDQEIASIANNPTRILALTPAGEDTYSAFAVLAKSSEGSMLSDIQGFNRLASDEQELINQVLHREEAITAVNFDPQIAGETAKRAIVALVLSWLAIIAYLWLRFGQFRWGLAAVVCLIHDAIITVGMVAAADWLSGTSIGQALMIAPFKIDLAMVAAILTIIGFSVNDTIVIFDRIRENRGKLSVVTPQIINHSINQTLSRTILTSFTVFMVVSIMYIWAGESIRGFNYALLIGVFFGCYSTIALAAPILLGFKKMVTFKAGAATPEPSPIAK